ncbi:MAG: riboflavin synthase [Planctomycetes bacterium]|nr:riboflavin synthase [Planctomycetota bacterium]
MFTGIIRHVGSVRSIRGSAAGARLVIALGPLRSGLGIGDSVAVNGACLTVVEFAGASDEAAFDAIGETLSRTTLGRLRAGSKVNLERALSIGDALDGHLVQGHVDGVAEVRSLGATSQRILEFVAGEELTAQMVAKGSVAIDGVSLTLVDVAPGRFSTALIPKTLNDTTLGLLALGQSVNVETDLIGKYVAKYLKRLTSRPGEALTMEKLREGGFA